MGDEITDPPRTDCYCEKCRVRRDELRLMNRASRELYGKYGIRWKGY